MQKTGIATAGSITTAIIASLCCIGPVAVALIGVGSIGAFSVFEAYRPYLISLTVVLLGFAFYLTYRKREVACEDGSCRIESAGRWSKFTVWLAALLAGIAIAFPYFNLTDTAAAQSMLSEQSRRSSNLVVAVLKIEGMDCKGCAKGLEVTLGNIEGVKKAAVEFEQGRAVVEYDTTNVKSEQLIAWVEETGFKARISSIKDIK